MTPRGSSLAVRRREPGTFVRWVERVWPFVGNLRRAYEAAAVGRLTSAIQGPSTSANAEIALALPTLRYRSRDLVRNNPHARKMVSTLCNNVIGDGITARPMCVRQVNGEDEADEKANRAALALWTRWVRECDAEGGLTFAGMQQLALNTFFESGEVLLRRRRRRVSDGLSVPLQLLEPDFLDLHHDGSTDAGRTIQGVEFDSVGRRRAYWLHQVHPGESGWVGAGSGAVSSRVPLADVAHVLQATRAGQVRGVPWLAPVAAEMAMLDRYMTASTIKREIEACMAVFVSYDDPNDAGIGAFTTDGTTEKPVSKIGPGMIVNVPNSKSITSTQPSGDSTAPAFVNQILHNIAAGGLVPHELMTGDLSQVNYSSIRAGLIEFRRMCSALQQHIVIPLMLDRVWGWFVEAAILSGALEDREGGYPVMWQPPKFEEVDREGEAKADLLELTMGATSIAEIIAQNGRDPEAVLREIARYRDLCASLGFVLPHTPPAVAPEPATVVAPLTLAKPAAA